MASERHCETETTPGSISSKPAKKPSICLGLRKGTGVHQHQGVIVDVDNPALRRQSLSDLMSVLRRRKACADIQERCQVFGIGL